MPFENTLPLVAVLGVAAVGSLLWWLQARERWLAVVAVVAAGLAGSVHLADRLVETDREQLTALLHQLAAAAEAGDLPTILAAIDPDAAELRADAQAVPADRMVLNMVTVDAAARLAAQHQNTAVWLCAAIDPSASELRADAQRILSRYEPSEARITKLFIEVDTAASPPNAAADLIVRATGRVDAGGTQASTLVGGMIELHKQGEQWLITSFEFRRLFEGGLGRRL